MKTPIHFQVNGLALRGNLYNPEQGTPGLVILFLHGWTGKPNEIVAEHLAGKGFITMTFGLSGHAGSNGDIADQTRQKSLQEVIAAYDFLRSHTTASIVAVGNSYGGYMAALLSAERSLAGISLRVPANYPDEHFAEKQLGQLDSVLKRKWRELPLEFNATRALRAVHDFDSPVQIIEAEFDELVPHQTVQNYVNAVNDKQKLDYHLMKGWPHSLSRDEKRTQELQNILLDWLTRAWY